MRRETHILHDSMISTGPSCCRSQYTQPYIRGPKLWSWDPSQLQTGRTQNLEKTIPRLQQTASSKHSARRAGTRATSCCAVDLFSVFLLWEYSGVKRSESFESFVTKILRRALGAQCTFVWTDRVRMKGSHYDFRLPSTNDMGPGCVFL